MKALRYKVLSVGILIPLFLIFIETRGQRSLNLEDIKCDYFEFIDNPQGKKELFDGEYMSDYSWGEYTLARIFNLFDKN